MRYCIEMNTGNSSPSKIHFNDFYSFFSKGVVFCSALGKPCSLVWSAASYLASSCLYSIDFISTIQSGLQRLMVKFPSSSYSENLQINQKIIIPKDFGWIEKWKKRKKFTFLNEEISIRGNSRLASVIRHCRCI